MYFWVKSDFPKVVAVSRVFTRKTRLLVKPVFGQITTFCTNFEQQSVSNVSVLDLKNHIFSSFIVCFWKFKSHILVQKRVFQKNMFLIIILHKK